MSYVWKHDTSEPKVRHSSTSYLPYDPGERMEFLLVYYPFCNSHLRFAPVSQCNVSSAGFFFFLNVQSFLMLAHPLFSSQNYSPQSYGWS